MLNNVQSKNETLTSYIVMYDVKWMIRLQIVN